MNALKGQRAHSPGQSEAAPWDCLPLKWKRPERAKAQLPAENNAFALTGRLNAITSKPQGVALGYVLLGFQPVPQWLRSHAISLNS